MNRFCKSIVPVIICMQIPCLILVWGPKSQVERPGSIRGVFGAGVVWGHRLHLVRNFMKPKLYLTKHTMSTLHVHESFPVRVLEEGTETPDGIFQVHPVI